MITFFEKENIVQCVIENDIIIAKWVTLYDEEIIKECTLAQLEQIKQGAKVIIVDTSTSEGVPPQRVQHWFASDLFPKMDQAGLKAMITVLPEKALTKLAADRWSHSGESFKFDVHEVGSMDEAMNIAKQYLEN